MRRAPWYYSDDSQHPYGIICFIAVHLDSSMKQTVQEWYTGQWVQYIHRCQQSNVAMTRNCDFFGKWLCHVYLVTIHVAGDGLVSFLGLIHEGIRPFRYMHSMSSRSKTTIDGRWSGVFINGLSSTVGVESTVLPFRIGTYRKTYVQIDPCLEGKSVWTLSHIHGYNNKALMHSRIWKLTANELRSAELDA